MLAHLHIAYCSSSLETCCVKKATYVIFLSYGTVMWLTSAVDAQCGGLPRAISECVVNSASYGRKSTFGLTVNVLTKCQNACHKPNFVQPFSHAVSKFFRVAKIWHTDCFNFDTFITAWIFGVKGLLVSIIYLV